MDDDKKEVGKWWLWLLGLVAISAVVFFVLDSAGIIGRTVVERKVFENSYQYSEARKTEIATYEAQLAELQAKLANPNLDDATRADIDAQMAAIRIQISAAKARQK